MVSSYLVLKIEVYPNMNQVEQENTLGAEQNLKYSFLWDYFELDPNNPKIAKCKVKECGKVFTSVYDIKNGNLHTHLKKHTVEYAEMREKRELKKLKQCIKTEKLKTEIEERKIEYSKFKCEYEECNYRAMSQHNLELHVKKGIHTRSINLTSWLR